LQAHCSSCKALVLFTCDVVPATSIADVMPAPVAGLQLKECA
jgi:hypothetical protein